MSLLKKSVNGAQIELSTVQAHILYAGENASVYFCYLAARTKLRVEGFTPQQHTLPERISP